MSIVVAGVKSANEDPAKVRRTRAEMRNSTRALLLSLARRMFGEQGFAAASIDELAVQASLTKGAIYHHFGSKQALFEAVVEDIDLEVEAQMQAIGEGLSGWELLRVSSYKYMRVLFQPGFRLIMLRDAPSCYPNFSHRPKQMRCVQMMAGTLEQLVGEEGLPGSDHFALATLISGGINNLILWAANLDDGTGLQRAERMLDLLIEGIRMRLEL